MKYVQMQGLGNSFVVINLLKEKLKRDPSDLAKYVCNKEKGLGVDGLLLLEKSDKADFKMRVFNPDGSEAEMCGNGIRCLVKYIFDNKISESTLMRIETLAGVRSVEVKGKGGFLFRVDMGEPILDPKLIPVNIDKEKIVDFPYKDYKITCVSMGNPHCVIFVKDAFNYPVAEGKKIEYDKEVFPKRVNVEFIQVISKRDISAAVWERGVGETLACGTGACAAVVASNLTGQTGREVTVHLKGGNLFIEWDKKTNKVYMTGPAQKEFEGEI